MKLTFDRAWEIVGGLSKPSKMPCYGWSLSATICKTGRKLAQIKGSVCDKCYAMRGNYTFPVVQDAMKNRLEGLKHPQFADAMILLIKSLDQKHFRWFDSGDLQDANTLKQIIAVAQGCPEVKFWLPTKEYSIVSAYIKLGHVIPFNLNIRLSGYMMEENGPIALAQKLHQTISEVRKEGFTCPSSSQGNRCGECRMCWDKSVFNVIYKRH
jgi:hypothetical protein